MKKFLLILALLSGFLYADNLFLNSENWCRDISLSNSKTFILGLSKQSTNFYVDSDSEYPNDFVKNCPELSNQCIDKYNQKIKSFDRLILGNKYKGFICSYNIRTQSSGWLPESIIKFQKQKPINCNEIVGKWHNDNDIIIKSIKVNNFYITGNALWENGSGSIHDGFFESNIFLKSCEKFSISNNDCTVRFYFISDKLMIAQDNHNCGGMNVSFSGVYFKNKFNQ